MQLRIRVPKEFKLKTRIAEKYLYLYQEYRRYYPQRKDYTYKQLRKNIADVASIYCTIIDSASLHNSTYIPWLDHDWKQFYYNHWYFAVRIEDVDGIITAVIQDAHYEGDHHNDILLSKPYDIEDFDKSMD